MDFLTPTVAGKAADHISSKFIDCIKSFKGQRNDEALGDTIRQELLDQYENEPFYNNLDSYLTCNKTIDSLILILRNSSPRPAIGHSEFVDKNFKQFLDRTPSCLAYSTQVKDAFSRIFNCAFFAITNMNPYSDCGRLQSEIRSNYAETSNQIQNLYTLLSDIDDRIPFSQNSFNSCPAEGAVKSSDVSARGNESVPGLFIINRETVTACMTNIDSSAIQAYLRISTNIENILYAVCSDMTIECMLQDKVTTLVDSLQNEVNKGSQAIFLLGNGGIGKSTALVQTAVRFYDSGENIYLFQLGSNHDTQIIFQVLNRIVSKPEKKHVLFIDNPYDNSEGIRDLLEKIQRKTNVQVVMSERLNRFDSIAEDILPDLYFISAKIIVPVLKMENIHIKKFDGSRILKLQISQEWKRKVILHMFRSIPNVDMPKIESITKKQNQMSIIEWYLRTCIKYNKWVDEGNALATRCKVKLDWDEWRELFHTPHPRFSEDDAKELRELFRVIAALDIFKIKASTKLLAQETRIGEMRLDSILRFVLNTTSHEPAIYTNDEGYSYIALKHDMISTLFFEVEAENPQLILEHIVHILGADKEAVISFEKQVFRRRYMQPGYKTPFNINAKKLYWIFAQYPSYYEILRERNRAYSFDVAEVWQQDKNGNEAVVSEMWGCVLEKYISAEPLLRNKILMYCLTDCRRRKIPEPEILLQERTSRMDLWMVIAEKDLSKITAAWKARFSQLYTCDITGQELIEEWRKAIFDYLLYAFDMPEEFFSIFAHVDYQVVDAAYAALENYVKRNRLDKHRYYKLGIRLYAVIIDHQRTDISSRMRLAHCYIQIKELQRAESIYCEILELHPNKVAANNSLGYICARRLKDEWKELEANDAEKKRLMEVCESSFKRAIELAEKDEDKSVCWTTLGLFLYRTMRNYQGSYNALQEALKYQERAAIHSQLGMLCSNYHKDNSCFSIDKAKYHFERAISLLKSRDLGLLSVYIPYANMYYCLGEYDKAIDLYRKAEYLGEQKATKMLKKIQDEREYLAIISSYPLKTMTTLEAAYNLTCRDPSVFVNEQQMREIFSLLLRSMADEGKTSYDIKQAIKILQNFRNSNSKYKYEIIAKRTIQQVESAAISYNIYKANAERNFRAQCFFISKAL